MHPSFYDLTKSSVEAKGLIPFTPCPSFAVVAMAIREMTGFRQARRPGGTSACSFGALGGASCETPSTDSGIFQFDQALYYTKNPLIHLISPPFRWLFFLVSGISLVCPFGIWPSVSALQFHEIQRSSQAEIS